MRLMTVPVGVGLVAGAAAAAEPGGGTIAKVALVAGGLELIGIGAMGLARAPLLLSQPGVP
jgi:hypothetical protein